jgi:transcriptional regulator with XRE-family HTH domain
MKFCDRLRQLRQETGLDQKEFVKKVNIPYTTYNHYETGRSEPDLDTITFFANYFNVSIEYITGKADNKNKADIDDKLAKLEKWALENKDGVELVNKIKKNGLFVEINNYVDYLIEKKNGQ